MFIAADSCLRSKLGSGKNGLHQRHRDGSAELFGIELPHARSKSQSVADKKWHLSYGDFGGDQKQVSHAIFAGQVNQRTAD
jgi:hypothetical protein